MRFFLLLAFLAQLIATQDCGQVCELDAFGQRLTYPNPIVAETVYATTTAVTVYKDLKGSYLAATNTKTANAPPKPTITWEVLGVTLTYPTTYVVYTDFSHSFVATEGGCSTGASKLKLGPSTNYASLIYPAAEIVSTLPPKGVVEYLESIPTVLAQLGGSVNSSCDPTSATPFASAPTVTLTTTNVLPGATVSTQTVTVSAVFQTMSGSVLTLPITTPRFKNTTTTVPTTVPVSPTETTATNSLSTTSETTVTSAIKISPGVTSAVVTFSGAISTLEKSTPPPSSSAGAVSVKTAPGPLSTGAGNFSGIPPIATFTGLANQFADAAYIGTGGWLAGVLGLAIYWL